MRARFHRGERVAVQAHAGVGCELLQFDPRRGRPAEGRLDGRGADDELGGRREKLDGDSRARVLAQREYALERGHASAGDQYTFHRRACSSSWPAGGRSRAHRVPAAAQSGPGTVRLR